MKKQPLSNRSPLFTLFSISSLCALPALWMPATYAVESLIGNPSVEVRGDFRIESEGAAAAENYGMTIRFIDASPGSPATIDMFSPRADNSWTWWSSFTNSNPPTGDYHMKLDETGSLSLYDVRAATNIPVIEFDTVEKVIRVGGKKVVTTSGAAIDGVSFSGNLIAGDAGANIPASGPGVRMMWYPEFAAFRSGMAYADEWDSHKVGLLSSAFGIGVEASGILSFASGYLTKASETGSLAMGAVNEASGAYSTVIGGMQNTVAGLYSTAFGGINNRALSDAMYASLIGGTNNAIHTGNYNMLIGGHRNALRGESSIVVGGHYNDVNADYALVSGMHNDVTGQETVVIGKGNRVEADQSVTLGHQLINHAYGAFIAGVSNSDHSQTADKHNWIATDPLFEVGNGADAGDRSNALTTRKNGQTTLTNKFWMIEDSDHPDANQGNALVVEGNAVMQGNLTVHGGLQVSHWLVHAQGDISMGAFTSGPTP